MANDPQLLASLQSDLKKAQEDLSDAQDRIKRIEEVIYGKDPHAITPDPNAMITILRDIREKMPALTNVAEDSKFAKRAVHLFFGSAALVPIVLLVIALKNHFL